MTEDRTPVLIGAGQLTQRDVEPADAKEPLAMMDDVARRAAADAGLDVRALDHLDTVAVVNILSWHYANAPALLAARLGATPAHAIYTGVGGNTPQAAAEDALKAVKQEGFTAVKMGPQPSEHHKMPWGRVLKEAAAKMEAVRRAVGDDVDICLDPHAQIFEPIRAWELAEAVKPFRPMFYEEPLRPENVSAMGKLREKCGIPIATGEMLYTKYQFRDVIAAGAADILQPDILLCGGLMEAKKIAALAEAEYLTVAPHNPMGPISSAVSGHFAISTPNFAILEYRIDSDGPARDLLLKPFKMVDGYLEVPDTPGLGIELNEKAFAGRHMKTWRRQLIVEGDGNIGYQ